jgi:hypothetical protein
MREPDVVAGEATSVHFQSRIVVGCRLPIGIGRNRIKVLSSPVAVALRHLATDIDQLLVPGELHQDPADSEFLKPLDSRLFGPGSHKASINIDSEDKRLAERVNKRDVDQDVRQLERRVPLALARHENQRRQDRLRFLEAQAHLPAPPTTPPQSGAGSAPGLPVLSTRPGA